MIDLDIQENFLKGGRFMPLRPDSWSVGKNIALNKALWALTEKTAELKGAA